MTYDDDDHDGFGGSANGDGRDYEVGYGKPPLHSRFQKGISGNPKGRKKKLSEIGRLKKLVSQKVELKINGEIVMISQLEALIRASLAKAVKGSTRDALNVVELLEKLGIPLVSEEEKRALDGSTQMRALENLKKIREEIMKDDEYLDLMEPYREKQQALVLNDSYVVEMQITFWIKFLEDAPNEVAFNTRLAALKAEKRKELMSAKLIKQITRRYRERNGNALKYRK